MPGLKDTTHDAALLAAARRHGVPAALLKAIAQRESGCEPTARALTGGDGKRGGSYGLCQMSLATARVLGYGGAQPTDADRAHLTGIYAPAVNYDLAAKYLADLLGAAARGGYGIDSAISAYNAGSSPLRPGDGKRNGVGKVTPNEARRTPFVNQRAYVDTVLTHMRAAMALGYSAEAGAYNAGGGFNSTAVAVGVAVVAAAGLAFVRRAAS